MLDQYLRPNPEKDDPAQQFYLRPKFASYIFSDPDPQHGEEESNGSDNQYPAEYFAGFGHGITESDNQSINAGGNGEGHDVTERVDVGYFILVVFPETFVNHLTSEVGKQDESDPVVDALHKNFQFGSHQPTQQWQYPLEEGKGDFGYNARLDVFQNLYESGVIDPAKVTRIALENAASIAGMFLTTECVLVEEKEEKSAMPPQGMGGGMGGMM